MTRREENRAKKRKYHIAKMARRAKNQRVHANQPRNLEIEIASLTTQLIETNRLMVVPRGNDAIPAFRDFLTVWNDHAHTWNNRGAAEKAAKLIDHER